MHFSKKIAQIAVMPRLIGQLFADLIGIFHACSSSYREFFDSPVQKYRELLLSETSALAGALAWASHFKVCQKFYMLWAKP